MKYEALSATEKAALNTAAAALGIPAAWLFAAIEHESAWNPAAKNPYSTARGLIQWIDSTAKDLGYSSSAALVAQHPTREAQLVGPVVAYLKKWKPITSLEDLAAVIFYPAYRKKLDTALPAAVQKANPGITTVRDYSNRYLASKLPSVLSGVGVALLLLGAVGWWWYAQRNGHA